MLFQTWLSFICGTQKRNFNNVVVALFHAVTLNGYWSFQASKWMQKHHERIIKWPIWLWNHVIAFKRNVEKFTNNLPLQRVGKAVITLLMDNCCNRMESNLDELKPNHLDLDFRPVLWIWKDSLKKIKQWFIHSSDIATFPSCWNK